MKNVLIIAMMLVSAIGFSQKAATLSESANAKLTTEEKVKLNVNRLGEKLELNEDQKAKIYTLQLEKAKQREAKADAKKTEMEKKKEAFKAERDNYDTQMKEILTADQYAKWKEMKKDKKQNHQGKKFDKSKKGNKNKN